MRPSGHPRTGAERAGRGYLTSLGTEPPLRFIRTLAVFQIQLHENVIAFGGGQQTGDANLNEEPGEKRTNSCAGVPAGALTSSIHVPVC